MKVVVATRQPSAESDELHSLIVKAMFGGVVSADEDDVGVIGSGLGAPTPGNGISEEVLDDTGAFGLAGAGGVGLGVGFVADFGDGGDDTDSFLGAGFGAVAGGVAATRDVGGRTSRGGSTSPVAVVKIINQGMRRRCRFAKIQLPRIILNAV